MAVPDLPRQINEFQAAHTDNMPAVTADEIRWRAGDLFDWIAAGELQVRIDQRYPLAQAADAHRYLEGRKTKGKILLDV